MNNNTIDINKISNVEVSGVDHKDYPDYCDAYVSSAEYDGTEMTEAELHVLNESDLVHGLVMDSIF